MLQHDFEPMIGFRAGFPRDVAMGVWTHFFAAWTSERLMPVAQSRVDELKRRAKTLKKQNDSALHVEQDKLAIAEGFPNWSMLMRELASQEERTAEVKLFDAVHLRFYEDGKITGERKHPARTVQLFLRRPGPEMHGLLAYVDDNGSVIIMANVYATLIDAAGSSAAQSVAALQRAAETSNCFVVPEHFPLVTSLSRAEDYGKAVYALGAWKVSQILAGIGELAYARNTGFRPAWYEHARHEDLMDPEAIGPAGYDDDDVERLFCSAWFSRACEADRLEYSLPRIPPGQDGASAFQNWVADALTVLFPAGLRRVHVHPNGKTPARRDIVASNSGEGPFWKQILQDFHARMVVFEAKNFAEPKPDHFRQVAAYLNAPHYGTIGFLVMRADTHDISKASLDQMREAYASGKVILVLSSAFLVEQLRRIWLGKAKHDDDAMLDLLETALLRQLA